MGEIAEGKGLSNDTFFVPQMSIFSESMPPRRIRDGQETQGEYNTVFYYDIFVVTGVYDQISCGYLPMIVSCQGVGVLQNYRESISLFLVSFCEEKEHQACTFASEYCTSTPGHSSACRGLT